MRGSNSKEKAAELSRQYNIIVDTAMHETNLEEEENKPAQLDLFFADLLDYSLKDGQSSMESVLLNPKNVDMHKDMVTPTIFDKPSNFCDAVKAILSCVRHLQFPGISQFLP